MATDMGLSDLANRIKNAKHAGAAKALSRDIADEASRMEWELSDGVTVMKELQYVKCYQCPEYMQCLYENRDCYFSEANANKLLASGMSEYVTKHTSPKFWPGKNLLGNIMSEISSTVHRIVSGVVKPGGVVEVLELLEFDDKLEIERQLMAEIEAVHDSSNDNLNYEVQKDTHHDDSPDVDWIDAEISEIRKSDVAAQPLRAVTDNISESCRKYRSNSLPVAVDETTVVEPFPQNIADFCAYLDKQVPQKRKETESSPDKTILQEKKSAKLDLLDSTTNVSDEPNGEGLDEASSDDSEAPPPDEPHGDHAVPPPLPDPSPCT